MELVRFYSAVIWLGVSLALLGQLKSCTLAMMGKAADATQIGIMSYSKLNRTLWAPDTAPAPQPISRSTK